MEDAVLHGCIPVILQDGIHTPWETVLDWTSYAIRVPRSQMARLPDILRAISARDISAMQASLRRVWPRFAYLSVIEAETKRHPAKLAAGVSNFAQYVAQDATATLIKALDARLRLREARSSRRHEPSTAVIPAAGCSLGPFDSDTSPTVPASAEALFKNVRVSGWTI